MALSPKARAIQLAERNGWTLARAIQEIDITDEYQGRYGNDAAAIVEARRRDGLLDTNTPAQQAAAENEARFKRQQAAPAKAKAQPRQDVDVLGEFLGGDVVGAQTEAMGRAAGQARDLGQTAVAGSVQGFGSAVSGVGEAINSLARTADRNNAALPGFRDQFGIGAAAQYLRDTDATKGLVSLGEAVKSIADKIDVAPEKRGGAAQIIANSVGQMATQVATGVVSRPAAGIALFGQGADQISDVAKEKGQYGSVGADYAVLGGAALMGLVEKKFGLDPLLGKQSAKVAAIVEKTGFNKLIGRLPDTAATAVLKQTGRIAKVAGQQGGEEYLEQVIQNVAIKMGIDPNQALTEGGNEAAIGGAGAGVIVDTILRMLPGRARPLSPRLTPEDQASPLADDNIAEGKEIIARAVDGPKRARQQGDARQALKNRIRQAESTGDDNAKNPLSSAEGRYQFTDGTFRKTYEQVYGKKLTDAELAKVKYDPAIQEKLMDRLTADNETALKKAGFEATAGNLYLAHFLGANGAVKALANPEGKPSAAVVKANPFLKGMSNADVARWAAGKMGNVPSPQSVAEAPDTSEVDAEFSRRMAALDAQAQQSMAAIGDAATVKNPEVLADQRADETPIYSEDDEDVVVGFLNTKTNEPRLIEAQLDRAASNNLAEKTLAAESGQQVEAAPIITTRLANGSIVLPDTVPVETVARVREATGVQGVIRSGQLQFPARVADQVEAIVMGRVEPASAPAPLEAASLEGGELSTAAEAAPRTTVEVFNDMAAEPMSDNLRAGVERMATRPDDQQRVLTAIDNGIIKDGDLLQNATPRWALENGYVTVEDAGNENRRVVLTDAGVQALSEMNGARGALTDLAGTPSGRVAAISSPAATEQPVTSEAKSPAERPAKPKVPEKKTPPKAMSEARTVRARADAITDRLYDMEINLSTKASFGAYAKKLVKDGDLEQADLDALSYMWKDRDMGPEDISGELRSAVEVHADRKVAALKATKEQRAVQPKPRNEDGQRDQGPDREAGGVEATAERVQNDGAVRGKSGVLDGEAGPDAGNAPLEGSPQAKVEIAGRTVPIRPSIRARSAAEAYMRDAGLPYNPPKAYAKVDVERAKRIADAYEAMPNAPNDPEVRAAYEALVRETEAQWRAIKATGLQVEFINFARDGDPYAATPRLAQADVQENNHLWIFATDDGYGQTGITAEDEANNPMLALVPGEFWNGQPVRVNDLFRAVHDYFGHIKDGHGFRATGEENAWQSHAAMYSPLARRAMTTETRGQNSWVNYGPNGEANRTASGGDTVFAEQKVGLMPLWVSEEGRLSAENDNDGRDTTGEQSGERDGVPVVGGEARAEGAVRTSPPVNEDGTVTLNHFSLQEGLTETDPDQWGRSGAFLPREERSRIGKAPGRTYFGIATGEPGGYVNEFSSGVHPRYGTPVHSYDGRVLFERLYDMANDPDGLKEQGRAIPQDDRGRYLYNGMALDGVSLYERLIQDAGYAGYWIANPSIGLTAAVYEPVAMSEPTKFSRGTPQDTPAQQARAEIWAKVEAAEAEVVEALRRMKLEDKVGLNVVSRIASGALGSFTPGTTITDATISIAALTTPDPKFTARHEAIHALRSMGFFSQSEWTALSNLAMRNGPLMDGVARAYPELDADGQLEEAIAENFALYMRDREAVKGLARRAYERLVRLIEAIKEAIGLATGMTRKEIDEALGIYLAVDSGAQVERGVATKEVAGGTKESRTLAAQSTIGDPTNPDPGRLRSAAAAVLRVIDAAASQTTVAKSTFNAKESLRGQLREAGTQRYAYIDRAQKNIEKKTGQKIAGDQDVMRALITDERAHKLEVIQDQYVEPMTDIMAEEKLTREDVGYFLYARHAPARNREIARRNPTEFNRTDKPGSGMTDAQAAQIIADFTQTGKLDALERVAAIHDALNAYAQQLRLDAGLINQQMVASGFQPGDFYTPLRGNKEMEAEVEIGLPINAASGTTGISVKGAEGRRAFGRKSEADPAEILGYVVASAQQAANRSWANGVGQTLLELARNNPDPGFWRVNLHQRKPIWNKATKTVSYQVTKRLDAEEEARTVRVKIDGQEHAITFVAENPHAMRFVQAAKNLDVESLRGLTALVATYTRFISQVNTSLNPDFMVPNMVRDIQIGLLNATSIDQAGLATAMVKNLASLRALRASTKAAFSKAGDLAGSQDPLYQMYDEYLTNGGSVGYAQAVSLKETFESLDTAMAKAKQWRLDPRRMARGVFDFIKSANDAAENMTRFAAYKAMVDLGADPKDAARVARELTVNFSQHGRWGPNVNAWFAFANAATIGTARLGATLATSRYGQAAIGSLMVASFLADQLLAMFWPEWDEFDEQEKNANFLIPTGGTQSISIPIGYGLNAFLTLARKSSELVRGKKNKDGTDQTVLEAGMDVGTSFATSFIPFSGSSPLGFISPTILDPFVDLAQNQNFFGSIIYKPDYSAKETKPDSSDGRDKTAEFWKSLAIGVNDLTGGGDTLRGFVDLAPETYKYLFDQNVGGAGRTVERGVGLLGRAVGVGDEKPFNVEDVPVARRFVTSPTVGATAEEQVVGKFYDRYNEASEVVSNIKAMAERGDPDLPAYRAQYPAILRLHSSTLDSKGKSIIDRIGTEQDRLGAAKNAAEKSASANGEAGGLNRKQVRAIMKGSGVLFAVGHKVTAEENQRVKDAVEQRRTDLAGRFNTIYDQTVLGAR